MADEEKSPTVAIVEALAEAMGSIPAIPKNGFNPRFKSSYMTLDDIVAALRPHLAGYGLFFVQTPAPASDGESDGMVRVATVLYHRSGASLDLGVTALPAAPISGGEPNAHSYGSAYTYARRYALSMAFGLSDVEDDDANGVVPETPAKKPAKKPAAPKVSGARAFFEAVVRLANVDEADARHLSRDLCRALRVDPANATESDWSDAIRALEDIGDPIAYLNERAAAAEATDPNGM